MHELPSALGMQLDQPSEMEEAMTTWIIVVTLVMTGFENQEYRSPVKFPTQEECKKHLAWALHDFMFHHSHIMGNAKAMASCREDGQKV